MPTKGRPLSCVFSSRLYVPDKEISTLAVFFDEIFLPYPYSVDPDALELPGFRDAGNVGIGAIMLEAVQEEFRTWKEHYKVLFNEGVLRTLAPPIKGSDRLPADYLDAVHKGTYSASLGRGKVSHWSIALGEPALALYAAYSTRPAPEFFLERDQWMPAVRRSQPELDTSTARLATLLGKSLFNYQFPQLALLPPEQILELRDFVRTEKEGFVAYLNSLTEELERYSKDGPGWEETAALKIVERKVMPQFLEFRRCLESKSASFWGKVLEAGGRFMQVDASPWTPKFYWALFEAITGSVAERGKFEEQCKTNAGQAFQYLAKLESKLPV
jgi:hypothetical protein